MEGQRYNGVCGSQNDCRIGRRATEVRNANAGPKLHWRLLEKSGFPALPGEPYFLADNKGHVFGSIDNFFLLTVCRLVQY